jgi:hypothetical protein
MFNNKTLITSLLPSRRALQPYRPHLERSPHLMRWLSAQPLHQTVSKLRFSNVFLNRKALARRSVHSPRDHFIIILIISDRPDWLKTRGKWPLARNPERSWWHRHTSLKLFWPQPMPPGQQVHEENNVIGC